MTYIPGRGHEALRRGRWSNAHTDYFLTFCTQHGKSGLAEESVRLGLNTLARRLDEEHIWHLRTAVIMPDHIHLLVSLAGSTDLPESSRADARVVGVSIGA